MSVILELRRALARYPVLDLATVAVRRRPLRAATQNVTRGGWGSAIDLEKLPEEQVAWRRQRVMPFIPFTWALSLHVALVWIPIIDLVIFILARIHLRAVDTGFAVLANGPAPILSLSPLGARLAGAAAGAASPSAQHIFTYWALDAIAFCAVCAGLIAVALAEFAAFARVIAAILVKSNGWADLLYRSLVGGLIVAVLGWALFATTLLDAYPATFGDELNRKTLGILLLGALHSFVAFILPLIVLLWCGALIGFIDGLACRFRRWNGPAQAGR